MVALSDTIIDITGETVGDIHTAYVRAPSRRPSYTGTGLVSTKPVAISDNGVLSVDLEPGPAVLVVLGDSFHDSWELYVEQGQTTIRDAVAAVAGVLTQYEVSVLRQLLDGARDALSGAQTAQQLAEQAQVHVAADHAHVEQSADHVDTVAQTVAAALEQANTFVQDQVPPYLQDAALKRTYASSDLTVSVTDPRFGAVCDWTSGSNGTDNTAAIKAAIAYARTLGPGAHLYYPSRGGGYRVTETIDHYDLNVTMDAAVVLHGTGVAVRSGVPTIETRNRRLVLRARHAFVTDWSNESDIAVQLVNNWRCQTTIMEATNATIGVQFLGDGRGCAFNYGNFGDIASNRIGIDYRSINGGYSNNNQHFGGSVLQYSSTHLAKSRYGVR